jgi:hypothetical protein
LPRKLSFAAIPLDDPVFLTFFLPMTRAQMSIASLFASIRSRSRHFFGQQVVSFLKRLLATRLEDDGVRLWASEPRRIIEAIAKVETSWALKQTPEQAIQLGVMYDLVNRHQDALATYRDAFHRFPHHPRLRHEAGIKLLRHGQPQDVRNFFASVLAIDPSDAFATLVSDMLEHYPGWIRLLSDAIRRDQRPSVLIACPVWGEPFATDFIRYLCASLLSPNNLHALAHQYSIHFAIFTTAETELRMRQDALFTELMSLGTTHFVHYPDRWVRYHQTMRQHYGSELGPYYSNNCKFLLGWIQRRCRRRRGDRKVPRRRRTPHDYIRRVCRTSH